MYSAYSEVKHDFRILIRKMIAGTDPLQAIVDANPITN